MKAKNKYRKRIRLDNSTTGKIIDCFVEDIPAVKVGNILGLNQSYEEEFMNSMKVIFDQQELNEKEDDGQEERGEYLESGSEMEKYILK